MEWERILAPIFITSPTYGTRACTVLCVDHEGSVVFTERSVEPGGVLGETVCYEFQIR